jgi:hypothetical protein
MNLLRDYAPCSVVPYAYARHALVVALTHAGITDKSSVALPSFICRDILASVHAIGANVVYYDVDERLKPIDLELVASASAILAVNYFGFPQDLAPFRNYCAAHNATLIEDNAHGLFSRDTTGSLLGTRGDFGILSMRKSFHVSTGAALIAPPGANVDPSTTCSHDADAFFDRVRFTLSRWERRTSLPLMPLMRTAIRTGRRVVGKPGVSLSSALEERILPSQRSIGCTSARVLEEQDAGQESMRRRKLFSLLAPEIGRIAGVSLLHGHLDDGVVPYGVPFRASEHARREVEKVARRYHVSTMPWPALPEATKGNAPAHYHDVWLVNFI